MKTLLDGLSPLHAVILIAALGAALASVIATPIVIVRQLDRIITLLERLNRRD